MQKNLIFLALICITPTLYAESSWLPEAKLNMNEAKKWNVGAGFTQKLLHVNGEMPNPYGISYVKLGAYLNDGNSPGGQIGFRYPYYLTGTQLNGYYIGAYAGTVQSLKVDGDRKARFGGGIDLAYVWLSKERISTLSVGLGAGQTIKNAAGDVVEEVDPRLQFSYTLSFGL